MRVLPGLPPYGPVATSFPTSWGDRGGEGLVVAFDTDSGSWIGNFRPGLAGIDLVHLHPNHVDAVVVSTGDLWVVNVLERRATLLLPAVEAAFPVLAPDGWIFSRQGLALARLGPQGLLWHSRRLSWDGFDRLAIEGHNLTGLAWSPLDDRWHGFRVELATGRSTGGSYLETDPEGWQKLAS